MRHRRRRIVLAVAGLFAVVTGAARAEAAEAKAKPPKPKPDCLDGVIYDDKKFESGLRPNDLADPGDFAMLIEAKSYTAKLNRVCVARSRGGGPFPRWLAPETPETPKPRGPARSLGD